MKKLLVIITGIIFILGLVTVVNPNQVLADKINYGIGNNISEPTGDPTIGYPQIAIRTNRTPERTNIPDVVKQADDVANQFPVGDYENRSKAVTEKLTEIFGSGSFGEAWIIIFNSDKPGDYISYGYHNG